MYQKTGQPRRNSERSSRTAPSLFHYSPSLDDIRLQDPGRHPVSLRLGVSARNSLCDLSHLRASLFADVPLRLSVFACPRNITKLKLRLSNYRSSPNLLAAGSTSCQRRKTMTSQCHTSQHSAELLSATWRHRARHHLSAILKQVQKVHSDLANRSSGTFSGQLPFRMTLRTRTWKFA